MILCRLCFDVVSCLYQQELSLVAVKFDKFFVLTLTQVTAKFGVPGLKVAMEWFGFYGGPVRSPLQPASDAQKAQLRQTFVENGFM